MTSWTPERDYRLLFLRDTMKLSFPKCGEELKSTGWACRGRYNRIKQIDKEKAQERMSAGPVEWKGDPDYRECLYKNLDGVACGKMFWSEWAGERICQKCRQAMRDRAPGSEMAA